MTDGASKVKRFSRLEEILAFCSIVDNNDGLFIKSFVDHELLFHVPFAGCKLAGFEIIRKCLGVSGIANSHYDNWFKPGRDVEVINERLRIKACHLMDI